MMMMVVVVPSFHLLHVQIFVSIWGKFSTWKKVEKKDVRLGRTYTAGATTTAAAIWITYVCVSSFSLLVLLWKDVHLSNQQPHHHHAPQPHPYLSNNAGEYFMRRCMLCVSSKMNMIRLSV
jgi:hypothetical protein